MQAKRTDRNMQIAFGALCGFGALVAGTVSGLSPELVVVSTFNRAFENASRVPQVATAASTNLRQRHNDGIAGSEAFWLGVANPEIAKAVAIGQPLTLKGSLGGGERRLIITDVREMTGIEGRRDETHIETSSTALESKHILIVCRDVAHPEGGDILLNLKNGMFWLSETPAEPQSL